MSRVMREKSQPHSASEVENCIKHILIINKNSFLWFVKSLFRNTHVNFLSLLSYSPALILKIQTLIIIIAETEVYWNNDAI